MASLSRRGNSATGFTRKQRKTWHLRVEDTNSADSFMVFGRGILHLSILVETMRREGYEMQLGQPKVIIKEIDGAKHEPMEFLTVQVPEEFSGKVIEQVTQRKGEILNIEVKGDRSHLGIFHSGTGNYRPAKPNAYGHRR
jgi:GTP-binding protein